LGKASKRKQKSFSGEGIKQPILDEENSPSFLVKYAFFINLSLITTTAFLIYSNTFSSPFQFDDNPNIVENYKLRDFSNFWPPSGSRYIGVLSFALNYHFGSLNVFGYHLVNIIIHIINSIMVWWLVILTFKTPAMQVYVGQGLSPALTPDRIIRGLKADLPYLTALTASLIFVSHPIQTQAVTYIVQRFASLATFFYILSLAIYIKARIMQETEKRKEKREKRQFSFIIYNFYFLISVLSAILAMKTKEISLTLPFVIILYEFMFFTPRPSIPHKGGGTEGGGIAIGMKQSLFVKRILYLIPLLLTLFIIPLSLIGTDKPVGDMIGELREASQETEEISRGVYLLTQFKVIVTYIRLLFLPINQNLDYDYPLSHSLFEPQTFFSFLFLSAIFAFAVYLFIRSRRTTKSPSPLWGEGKSLPTKYLSGSNAHGLLISFGIFWFFITLSVESSIIPIRDVIFEHRLYLPSVGIVIAFSSAVFYGTSYARERLGIKVSLLLAACILLLVTAFPLGIATYKRNLVWKDDIALWDDVVRKSPEKARPHNNLGLVYAESGQIEHAISEYKTTLRIDPDFSETRINLGIAYYKQGKIDEALTEYKIALIALKTTSYSAKIYNNMGNTYAQQGNLEEAYQSYIMALKLKPDYPEAHNNLGVTYNEQGLVDEAIHEYKAAINLNPDYADAHNNLGIAYAKLNQIDAAIEEFKEALRLKSNNAEMHYNLGNAYRIKGLSNAAIKEYEHALQLSPEFTPAKEVLESLTLK